MSRGGYRQHESSLLQSLWLARHGRRFEGSSPEERAEWERMRLEFRRANRARARAERERDQRAGR